MRLRINAIIPHVDHNKVEPMLVCAEKDRLEMKKKENNKIKPSNALKYIILDSKTSRL